MNKKDTTLKICKFVGKARAPEKTKCQVDLL